MWENHNFTAMKSISILSFIICSLLYCTPKIQPSNISTARTSNIWIPLNAGETASFRGLHAVNENIVWVSGSNGVVLRTTDAGKTWERKPIPNTDSLQFRDVHAFNQNLAFVISAGLPAKIYKTINGGESWNEVYASNQEGVFFDAMDFWDKKHGIAFSDPINGHLFIITTADGGETWQEVPKENIPSVVDGEAGFAASGTCLTVQGDKNVWIGTGGKAARVFRSTDRGKSWKVSATPIAHGKPSTGIFSLAFKDASNGIAIGGDFANDTLSSNNIATTTDGGTTWRLMARNPYGYKSCITYINGTKLIAVGTSGTDISHNSGLAWQKVDTTGYHVVSFSKNGKVGFAAGGDGRIARFNNLSEQK